MVCSREITWARRLALVVPLHLCFASIGWGGEWTITPRVTVRETYTDNVALAPKGQEEWDLVTQINPGISMSGKGRRLNLNLNYRLQTLLYARDSDRNDVFHQLGSRATIELIKEHFFVDGKATVSQRNLFNTGRTSQDNISGNAERTNVVTYSLSPYWRQRFDGYADALLRYRTSWLESDTGSLSDSTTHVVTFNAQSGRRFTDLTWDVRSRYRLEEREDVADLENVDNNFEELFAEGTARFALTREFYLLGVLGYIESDFRTSRNFVDGEYWSAGAGWRPSRFFNIEGGTGKNNEFVNVNVNPSRRTSLSVSYINRSVGSNPGPRWEGSLGYTMRRWRFRARYREETTTTQQVLLDEDVFPVTDPFGDPVPDPSDDPLLFPEDIPTLTNEVFIRKRFTLFGSIRATKKSTFDLTLFDEQREFLETGEQEDVVGARITWNWRLRRLMTLITRLGLNHTEFRESASETEADDGFFRVDLRRTFGQKLDGSLGYRYRRRDSANEEFSFDENRVEARVRFTL